MASPDITKQLNDYIKLLSRAGVPKNSTEASMLAQASTEIKALRKSLKFQTKLADEYNQSRLFYMDCLDTAGELYAEAGKEQGKRKMCALCTECEFCEEDDEYCNGEDFNLNSSKFVKEVIEKTEEKLKERNKRRKR